MTSAIYVTLEHTWVFLMGLEVHYYNWPGVQVGGAPIMDESHKEDIFRFVLCIQLLK